jgi:hypothetical protein
MHGWLVGALADKGYQQRDLARAWKVDDAVASRFINSGKPDLTPHRQMILAQMLGLSNDQLLAKLYGDNPMPRVIPLRVEAEAATNSEQPLAVQAEMRRAVERLETLLPGANVTINISYRRGR